MSEEQTPPRCPACKYEDRVVRLDPAAEGLAAWYCGRCVMWLTFSTRLVDGRGRLVYPPDPDLDQFPPAKKRGKKRE